MNLIHEYTIKTPGGDKTTQDPWVAESMARIGYRVTAESRPEAADG